jgi:hypothetical protein
MYTESIMRHNEIKKQVNEGGLASLADMAERDHEVQMARADLYKIAKYAIKLHDMLKSVSEAEGIEGWQQSKITKAADYVGSVYHAMDYDTKFANEAVAEAKRSSYKDGLSAMLETKKGKDEKFKPHMMYDPKTGKSKMAKVEQDHKDMAKKGWTHEKPTVKEDSKKKVDNCSKCGNPSYTTLDEEKKKGSHGKVCWKGYRRGKGDSCHRVKGDA